jgi:hypothetical protein
MDAKKGSSVTFRIDQKYEEALRELAKERRISLNTLANQIFGNFVEFEVFAQKFGTVRMSSDTFRRIIDTMDEKEIIEVAIRGGSQEAKEFILFKWKELNLQNVVDFIRMYFDFCGYGRCDLEQTEGKITVSVHHDFQKKGSLYLKHFLESLIQTSLNKETKTITTADTITLQFRT